MATPVTEIDTRYSDPDAMPTDWDQTQKVIENAEVFWCVTVRADGRPHVTPVVAAWADGAIHFTTGSTEQKAANLAANPHVILMTGCNQWDDGLDVVVEGDAVQVTDEDDLSRLAGAWAHKWDGRWRFVVQDGGFKYRYVTDGQEQFLPAKIRVFSVVPAKVLAFGRGNFAGHTTHRF